MDEVISTVMQKYENKCRQKSTLESFLAFWTIKFMALRFFYSIFLKFRAVDCALDEKNKLVVLRVKGWKPKICMYW